VNRRDLWSQANFDSPKKTGSYELLVQVHEKIRMITQHLRLIISPGLDDITEPVTKLFMSIQ
jgi:hypothetical protein